MNLRPKGDPVLAVRLFVKPGQHVVDVGANRGTVTEVMAMEVGLEGHVDAIEPHPGCQAPLQGLVERFPWVTVHPCAAVATAGSVALWENATDSAQSSLAASAVKEPVQPMLSAVEGRRLDDLVTGDVDFVKIDVQGAECRVLEGASRLLTQCPIWFIECWPFGLAQHGDTWQGLIGRLRAAGLQVRYQQGSPFDDVWFTKWADGAPRQLFTNLEAVRG